jgi:hypothetical protein
MQVNVKRVYGRRRFRLRSSRLGGAVTTQRPSGVYRKPQARAGRPLAPVSVAGWPRSFESVDTAATDGLGPVTATPARNVRAQRHAAPSGDGE